MRGQLRLLDTLLCPMMTDGRTCVHKKSRLGLVQQIWLVGWQDHVRIHQPTLTQQIPSLRSWRTRWWMRWTTCHFADAFLMLYTMKTKTKLSSRVWTSNFWFAETVTQKVSFAQWDFSIFRSYKFLFWSKRLQNYLRNIEKVKRLTKVD